jgi:serine/threonine protein kinase
MVSNLIDQDYCCFLHPQRKHSEFPDHCPDCGLPYDFPLNMRPEKILDRRITEGIKRGFYGAVLQAAHPTIRNRITAIKVIPKATYAPEVDGGYMKDFNTEVELYEVLSEINLVARLIDAGESDITFGQHTIPCYWLEMEYVKGPLLNDIVEQGPQNPRIIAQIAYDLLDLSAQLSQREKFHNDLHGGNIKVVLLTRDQERGTAIAKNIQTKILDLGSVADASKSGIGRWSDVHQVANHIIELTVAYERNAKRLAPGDLPNLCTPATNRTTMVRNRR